MNDDTTTTETVDTNEGELPSSNAANGQVETTNVNPTGVDVGTNALELQNDPFPAATTDPDLPASSVVRNIPAPTIVGGNTVNPDGSYRRIEGDYTVDYLPGNDAGADEDEEYTQTVETEDNDFEGVTAEVVPEGEEVLEKPRRYSRQ